MKTIHERVNETLGRHRSQPAGRFTPGRGPVRAAAVLTASLLGVALMAAPAGAYPAGVAGYAGAPGDPGPSQSRTCTQCHSGGTFEGTLEVLLPEDIVAGEIVPIDVVFTPSGESPLLWGFNLIALETGGKDPEPVGQLGSEAGSQVLPSDVQWDYLSHTLVGTQSTVDGKPGWMVEWEAPSEAVDSVRFYATFNASNGGGQFGSTIFEPQEPVVVSVPEPGAASAALVALCALAAVRRRRRD